MFRSNIYNDIKKFYIVVGKLFSTHATVCTSLILQASNGAGLIGLLLKGGVGGVGYSANHPNPEATHAGG